MQEHIASHQFRVPPSHCPYCDHLLDAATGLGGRQAPAVGDWTVCLRCAQILVFEVGMIARKPHPGELERMTREHWLLRVQLDRAVQAIRASDRKWMEPLNRQQRRRQERERRHQDAHGRLSQLSTKPV